CFCRKSRHQTGAFNTRVAYEPTVHITPVLLHPLSQYRCTAVQNCKATEPQFNQGASVAVEEHISQIRSGLTYQLSDRDPEETQEWMDSFDSLVESQGTERAQFIIRSLLQRAGAKSVGVPHVTTTDYVNTIPVDQEPEFPGDEAIERRYRAFMRWNAAIMVHRAQNPAIGVGGHISTYAGAATL